MSRQHLFGFVPDSHIDLKQKLDSSMPTDRVSTLKELVSCLAEITSAYPLMRRYLNDLDGQLPEVKMEERRQSFVHLNCK
jgi:hypothetical protein